MGRLDSHSVANSVGSFLKVVSARRDMILSVSLEEIGEPGSPSATPDQAQRDLRVRLASTDARSLDHRNRRSSGTGKERTTRDAWYFHFRIHAFSPVTLPETRYRRRETA
jgi:hypothetical protein